MVAVSKMFARLVIDAFLKRRKETYPKNNNKVLQDQILEDLKDGTLEFHVVPIENGTSYVSECGRIILSCHLLVHPYYFKKLYVDGSLIIMSDLEVVAGPIIASTKQSQVPPFSLDGHMM